MNAKITINPAEFTCARRSCRSTTHPIDRHHVRNQKLFVRAFEWRDTDQKYKKFVKRYESFDPKDIRLLCRDCHSELHEEYTYLRLDAEYEFDRYIQSFTWKQANQLMSRFEKFFKKWIKDE